MNILFVLYDGFHSNSANFVVGYANALAANGQNVAIAVPTDVNGAIEAPKIARFQCVSHEQVARGFSFANGKAPDVVHAWTPRENVRSLNPHREICSLERANVRLKDWGDALITTALAASEAFTLGRANHNTLGNQDTNKCRVAFDKLRRAAVALGS